VLSGDLYNVLVAQSVIHGDMTQGFAAIRTTQVLQAIKISYRTIKARKG
jgi:hypothetical protein